MDAHQHVAALLKVQRQVLTHERRNNVGGDSFGERQAYPSRLATSVAMQLLIITTTELFRCQLPQHWRALQQSTSQALDFERAGAPGLRMPYTINIKVDLELSRFDTRFRRTCNACVEDDCVQAHNLFIFERRRMLMQIPVQWKVTYLTANKHMQIACACPVLPLLLSAALGLAGYIKVLASFEVLVPSMYVRGRYLDKF